MDEPKLRITTARIQPNPVETSKTFVISIGIANRFWGPALLKFNGKLASFNGKLVSVKLKECPILVKTGGKLITFNGKLAMFRIEEN